MMHERPSIVRETPAQIKRKGYNVLFIEIHGLAHSLFTPVLSQLGRDGYSTRA